MAIHVKLTYEDGFEQTYVVVDKTVRLYGVSRNGRRPHKAYCWLQGTALCSMEIFHHFLDKYLRRALRPKHIITFSPELQELYDADSH
jgi:hypothetical protein